MRAFRSGLYSQGEAPRGHSPTMSFRMTKAGLYQTPPAFGAKWAESLSFEGHLQSVRVTALPDLPRPWSLHLKNMDTALN